jgi:exonuclease SbcD
MKADYEADILDGYVRLEVTDAYAGMEALALFRERYSNLLEMTSKSFEAEDTKITMTIEELEQTDLSPETVFKKYYQDSYNKEPSEHLLKLFKKAVREISEKEAVK